MKEFKAGKFRVKNIIKLTLEEQDHKLKLGSKEEPISSGVGVETESNAYPGTYYVVLFVKPGDHNKIVYEDVDGRIFKEIAKIILHKNWDDLKDFVRCVNRAYKIVKKSLHE